VRAHASAPTLELSARLRHTDTMTAAADDDVATSDATFLPAHPERLLTFVLPLYVGIVAAYALGAAYVTGCAWYAMPVYYWLFMGAFYVWHYQAHTPVAWLPFNAACRAYHTQHHWVDYPPTAFFGTAAKRVAKARAVAAQGAWTHALPLASSFAHEALLYVQLAVILVASAAAGVRWPTLAAAVLQAGIIGYVGNLMHESFHARDSAFARFRWWRELRALHYVHHLGSARHNYSIGNFAIDAVMGSFFGSPAEWRHTVRGAAAAATRAE
jgi:hypothetical protein